MYRLHFENVIDSTDDIERITDLLIERSLETFARMRGASGGGILGTLPGAAVGTAVGAYRAHKKGKSKLKGALKGAAVGGAVGAAAGAAAGAGFMHLATKHAKEHSPEDYADIKARYDYGKAQGEKQRAARWAAKQKNKKKKP